jgi:catalase
VTNKEMTMTHGQFYKSSDLVEAVHRAFGGIFPGFRAAHAFGRIYAGAFTPTAAARTLSRAAHFGEPVPATARFSGDSGNPNQKPSNVAGMGVKFYLPDGTITDLVALTLPAFMARTPEEFIDFLAAKAPDPMTGRPDMAKLGAFLAGHPNAARVVQTLQVQPALASFAQVSYRPLHAFRFINAAGEGRWARYHWEPDAGIAGQPPEELAEQPRDYLFNELEARLRQGPVTFRLDLELAQDGDPLDDPSAYWPEGRRRVTVGRLALTQPITEDQLGDPSMMHDPTRVTDGIEVSPDDQILAARRGAYLLSVAQRTGGWQQKSPDLVHALPVEAAQGV